MNKDAMTAPEVAQVLKISPNTVYELVKRGELNCYRVGRKMRFTYEDVQKYIGQSRGVDKIMVTSGKPAERSEQDTAQSDPKAFYIYGQDEILDVLAKYMNLQMPELHIERTHKGSYDSLIALYKNQAKAAAAHMWDSETNEYNTTYVGKLVPGCKVVIIHVAKRSQGFYVAEGNPKQITGWEDLKRPDIRIANREPGAGTRILLDEHLKRMGMVGSQIKGYEKEYLTHLAVAGCIGRGDADLGIGTEKTAGNIRGVDFIPLQMEQYDLVVKEENFARTDVQLMVKILQSEEFREQFSYLNGYDVANMGQVVKVET